MQKALFLDRDGVINKMVRKHSKSHNKVIDDSPFKVEELVFNEGIEELVKVAKDKEYKVIVVTNQPSILKGEFSMQDYEKITTEICKYLELERGDILECFHKEGLSLPCMCRKPEPGLIFMAKGLFDLDLKESIMVGDSSTDIVAGQRASVGKTIYLRRPEDLTQFGNKSNEEKMIAESIKPTCIVNSLAEVIELL